MVASARCRCPFVDGPRTIARDGWPPGSAAPTSEASAEDAAATREVAACAASDGHSRAYPRARVRRRSDRRDCPPRGCRRILRAEVAPPDDAASEAQHGTRPQTDGPAAADPY